MDHVKFLTRIVLSSIVMLLFLEPAKTALAQGEKRKPKFSSVNEAGLLTGEKGEAMMVHTLTGIKKNRSFAGIGVGLDFYADRSIPLFLDYRQALSSAKNAPFAYADAGVNFLWLNFIQKEQRQFPSSLPGLYYDFGIGWKLSVRNNRGFVLSAGYTLKQVKYKVLSYSVAPTPQMQSENYDHYNFLYRRLVIKVGLEL